MGNLIVTSLFVLFGASNAHAIPVSIESGEYRDAEMKVSVAQTGNPEILEVRAEGIQGGTLNISVFILIQAI